MELVRTIENTLINLKGNLPFSLSNFVILLSFTVLLLFLSPSAHAATVYWVGGSGTWDTSSTTHWSSSSGGASGATAPGSSDVAVFDGNSGGGTVTVGANLSVSGISLTGATTSTITQGVNTVTIGSGNYSQAGGTFTGGSATITNNGSFSLSGGTFTSTSGALIVAGNLTNSGGTFNHNSGTLLLNGPNAATFTPGSSTYNNVTLNSGLYRYWPFDESSAGTSYDASGYGSNGTDHGTTVSSSVPSVITFADPYGRSFNGTSDYVQLGTIPALSQLSVSFWIKRTSGFGTNNQERVIMCDTLHGGGFGVYFQSADTLNFGRPGTDGVTASGGAITDSNWHHVAVTYDGSTVRFYVDGVSAGSSAYSVTLSSDTYSIARAAYGGFLHGVLDDFRIYNRALSASEVAALASGSGPIVASAASSTISGRTVTLGGPLTASGSCITVEGTVDASSSNYNVSCGAWSNSGIFTPHSDTLTVTGTGTLSDAGSLLYNLAINGSGKTVTLGTNISVSNACSISAGTLDASSSSYNMTCSTWSNSGTFTPHSDSLILTGTGTLADITPFYNLTINGSGQIVTLGANLATTNNLTITAGTLDVSTFNYGVIVGGNFTNSGTFTPRSGIVTISNSGNGGSNLIGYWKFDETSGNTSADSSGSGNTGTYNGTTISSDVPSTIAFTDPYSRSFNGTSDYITIPNLAMNSFSVSLWAKRGRTTFSGNKDRLIGGNVNGWGLYFNADGTLGFGKIGVSGTSSTGKISDTTVWHHIVLTYDGSTAKFYIDGALTDSNAYATTFTDAGQYAIGDLMNDTTQYYQGLLDDVRVYNRLLSASEIATLATGNPLKESTLTGATTFYNFTVNGSGQTVTLGANLTASNACTITAGGLDASTSSYNISCGSWSDSGTFTPHFDTVTLTGTGTLSDANNALYNLTINGSGRTVTLGTNITASNNLTVAAGSLDASPSNYSLAVGGNWSNAGTFAPRSSTVTLSGFNQSIAGSSTFYNLTKSVTSADILTLPASTNTTIINDLTLRGDANSVLKIRSSSSGTPYTLNLSSITNPSTQTTLSYVDFQDATVTLPISLQLIDSNGKDSGDNTNIVFAQTGGAIGSGSGVITTTATTTPTTIPTPSPTPLPETTPTIMPTPAPSTAVPAPTPSSSSTPPTAPSSSSAQSFVLFTHNLKPGDRVADVLRLQVFLNSHGYTINPSVGGPGSPGHETDYFGHATADALSRFQEAHAAQILSPAGFKKGTGWFYDHTREYVNQVIQGGN